MLGGTRIKVGVMIWEEADSGEEIGVQADGGKKRKVGNGRFGGGSNSSRVSPDYLVELLRGRRRRTRPPSSGTWGRMEVTMCLLLRVTNLKSVFVVRI